MEKDIEKVAEATEAEETHEETEAEETATEEESEETKSKDVDFNKELEKLENAKRDKYTPEEKARYNLQQALSKAQEVGVDPSELIEQKDRKEKTDSPVSVDEALDRKFAERDARSRAKSDAEFKVIMHYVNKGLDVDEAYLLAHKEQVKRLGDEMQRSQVRFAAPSSPGQRAQKPKTPMLSDKQQQSLREQGFEKQTDGSWQGKHVRLRAVGNGFVEEKRVAGTKDKWEPVRGVQEGE